MLLPFSDVDHSAARLRRAGCWEWQPAPHPFRQHGDLRLWQFPRRRHLDVLVVVPNRLSDQTFLDVSHDRSRAAVPAIQNPLATVEQKPALYLFRLRRVTLKTTLNEHRTHSLLEEVEVHLRCLLSDEC